MSEAIGVMKLVGDSRRFVFSNLDVLKADLKIIFPLVLIIELTNSLVKALYPPVIVTNAAGLQTAEFGWQQIFALFTVLLVTYLYACFALSWHRSSLMGASVSHAVNPLSWDSHNKSFIKLFFAMIITPFIISVVVGVFIGLAMASHNTVIIALTSIAAIVVSALVFILLIRVSFMLPARSVDVALSMADAKRASHGLVWKIMGSGLLIGACFVGALFIYAMIVSFTVAMISKGAEPSALMTGLITFFFGVPVQMAGFVVTAINITVLSRAYQWGMQNNS